MLRTSIGRLRLVGLLEGSSFLLLLLIAMPLKYLFDWPYAVRVIGMAHGVLFVAFIYLSTVAKFVYDWPLRRLLMLWIASVVPFGTFYADRKFLRGEEQTTT